jgi:hypothetical protein
MAHVIQRRLERRTGKGELRASNFSFLRWCTPLKPVLGRWECAERILCKNCSNVSSDRTASSSGVMYWSTGNCTGIGAVAYSSAWCCWRVQYRAICKSNKCAFLGTASWGQVPVNGGLVQSSSAAAHFARAPK